MDFIELLVAGEGGLLRFNLKHLIGYNETDLYLTGGIRLELREGTATLLDKLLKERSACAFLRVEPNAEG